MMALDEGDLMELSASEPARLVAVEGKPHGEEIVLRGSFV
jgi:redox-sensitive bicupin YhaK (pirin superfamily)